MLRPTTCGRKFQRQLLNQPDFIWVSDEQLCHAFDRFCRISKSIRRHGSSVPGPLESRRRLGKRRMAHITEREAPTYDPATLWGSRWGSEKFQWQWEAPAPPTRRESDNVTALPSWLSGWTSKEMEDVENTIGTEEPGKDSNHSELEISKYLEDFYCASKTCPPMEVLELCEIVNKRFRQSLTLGLVSSDLLLDTLEQITNVLKFVSEKQKLDMAQLQLAFHLSVWEGITSCKVLKPTDFNGRVLGHFLTSLAELPGSMEQQSLASKVLSCASPSQLEDMLKDIEKLMRSWFSGFALRPDSDGWKESLADADSLVRIAQQSSAHARHLSTTVCSINPSKKIRQIRSAISKAKMEISNASDAIVTADAVLMKPNKLSIELMATALANVPRHLLLKLASSCFQIISAVFTLKDEPGIPQAKSWTKLPLKLRKRMRKEHQFLCYHWLSVMSRLKNIGDETFPHIWRAFEFSSQGSLDQPSESPSHVLREWQIAELILYRWIHQGHIQDGLAVWTTVKATGLLDRENFKNLFRGLEKHRQLRHEMFRKFLDILFKIQSPYHNLEILQQFFYLTTEIDSDLLMRLIDTTSTQRIPMANGIFTRFCKGKTPPEFCTPLIVAMIHNGNISSRQIWHAIGEPVSLSFLTGKWYPSSPRHALSKSHIHMINEMAVAFSEVKDRSERVALRNVIRCLSYLRSHGADVTPEVSRAVAKIAITRDIIKQRWIRTERFTWALEIIARGEGAETAAQVDRAVFLWREKLTRQAEALRREANVLGPGRRFY